MIKTPTLIIGAGPYGLSLANYLAAQGKEFLIAGKPLELWRKHTFDSMTLRSDCATSVIKAPGDKFSFERFCQLKGCSLEALQGQIPVKIFREYLDWCQGQFSFPIREEYATNLSRAENHYRAMLESGIEINAQRVVVATGIAHHLYLPPELKPAKRLVHSYYTRTIQNVQGKRVLVVGAGQSAAESVQVLLSHNNQVEWYTRHEPVFFSEPLNVPQSLFKIVVRFPDLFHQAASGLLKRLLNIFSATTITPNYRPLLEQVPRHIALPDLTFYDVVVAATGYRCNLKVMTFLNKELKASLRTREHMPVLSSTFESSLPGLYFLGTITEPFFGPSMKFMIGSQYAARKLSSVLN